MRVGVLTGGGDCPGLNAVIRAIVRKGVTEYGFEFVGFLDGWRGPLERRAGPLISDACRAIQSQRCSPSPHPEAAAPGDELGGIRCSPAPARKPHDLVH